jgi:hypothetical protein
MSNEYYIWRNEKQEGPFTALQLRSMWHSGTITTDVYYWREGLSDWTPLSEIAAVLESEPESRNNRRKKNNRHFIAALAVSVGLVLGILYLLAQKEDAGPSAAEVEDVVSIAAEGKTLESELEESRRDHDWERTQRLEREFDKWSAKARRVDGHSK